MLTLKEFFAQHKKLYCQNKEINELQAELEQLRAQNESMREGMRRCTTCAYRIDFKTRLSESSRAKDS